MKMRLLLCLIIGFLMFSTNCVAQIIPTEDQARQELKKRGLDEAEVTKRLLDRDVDINNIDTSDPNKLLEAQKAMEEVIAELEAEKNQQEKAGVKADVTEDAIDNIQSKSVMAGSEEVIEAVEDGATIEEAINEEIQEQAKEALPAARIYGHHIFRNNSVKFYRKSTDANPPSTYRLGPGDKISVAIWGVSELNFSQEISRDGFIKPDRVSRIFLAGLSIAEAKKVIKRKLSRYYRFSDNTFEVNVTTARTINVNITGEVFNVGSYSMSALNTAFNALVAAGGPSDIGSVRNIKVSSAGGKSKTLDIYKFLINPLITEDFYLNDNDYIIVPIAEKVVDIRGAVNRPYRYELLEGEDLTDLLKFAGGLKANALKRNIRVKRIENDAEVILNVNLNAIENKNKSFQLKNGDVVEILSITDTYKNIVSVKGSVNLPGEYAFKKGMRVSDLLSIAKPDEDAILSNAFLIRLNPDRKTVRYEIVDLSDVMKNRNSTSNKLLQEGDVLTIRSRASFVDSNKFSVSGAVRIEGDYPFNGGEIRVSDAIFLSGGLTDEATDFAFILRDKKGVRGKKYISVDLAAALVENPTSNIILQPEDRLVVYNQNRYVDESFVSIGGAVREPQQIQYDTSLTIKKAILLAGGLTYSASYQQIDVFRLSFEDNRKTKTLVANVSVDEFFNLVSGDREFKLEPFDQIFVRQAPEFEFQRNVLIEGEVKYPGSYALISENTKLSEVIKLAGGVTDEAFLKGASLYRKKDDVGYIIVDLEKALKNNKSTANAILQEGDVLKVPKINNLVTVTGAVLASEAFTDEIAKTGKFNFIYEKGKNAKYYVDKYAGGVAKNGKSSKITVTYPNGEVKRTKRFLFFNSYPKVEPGSVISVGYKDVDPEKSKKERKEIDWNKVLSDSVAQATTILTLVLLIDRLN